MKVFVVVAFVSIWIIGLDGWGLVGHNIVARLAQSRLNKEELAWMNELLPWHWQNNLSAIASWSDDILYADANPTGYPNWQWSRPLHYINTPDWLCQYNRTRDCVDDECIEGAIRNYTKRLETEVDRYQRHEALYFLVHFVGDIHQPLHTGFIADRGGNSIRGKLLNATSLTNLHTIWDSTLITTRVRRNFQSNNTLFYQHIYQIMTDQKPEEADDQIDTWINENIKFVCGPIYQNEENGRMNASTNFTLGEEYYNRSIAIVEQRLAQGGRRLGAILKALAEKRPTEPAKEKEKLSAVMIALIAIVSAESALLLIIGAIFLFRRFTKKT